MSYLGAIHAKVTQYASDGGIDVEATDYIAQVKNYTRTVGVAAVREFSGVAKVDGRMGLFFTSGNYAAGAIDFADKADIALFRYSAEQGELYAANFKAEGMLERGLI
jgi:restriction endonuclease Mrr